MSNALKVNDNNFQSEVLDSKKPVLVDIATEWCGPCKMLTPIIDKLALEYKDKIKIVTLDADESPKTASKYNVLSVPTLLFVKNGEVIDTHIGLAQKDDLEAKLEELL